MMVAGCKIAMVCISAISPIPVPCLSTCMPSFYLGRRCVRQEAITNFADGLSHINNGAKRKPGSPSARSPSRVQIFVSDHPPSLGQRSRAVAPYRPSPRWTREPSSAATNTRRAGGLDWGPFFAWLGVGPLVFSNFLTFSVAEAMQPVD